jgi:hypothetical protein
VHATLQHDTIVQQRLHKRPVLLGVGAFYAFAVEIQRKTDITEFCKLRGLVFLDLAPSGPGVRYQHAGFSVVAGRFVPCHIGLEQDVAILVLDQPFLNCHVAPRAQSA